MKKIIFMRHGKADAESAIVSDYERNLTHEGREAIRTLKLSIQEILQDVDITYCSPANRTCQTLNEISDLLSKNPKIFYPSILYQSSIKTIEKVIHETPNYYNQILIIAHNPALSQIIHHAESKASPIDTLPPAGVIVCNSREKNWQGVLLETCQIEKILTPPG